MRTPSPPDSSSSQDPSDWISCGHVYPHRPRVCPWHKSVHRPPLFFSGFFSAFLFSFCGFSFLGWTSAKGLPLCAKGLSCAGSGTTGSCLGISVFGGSITGFGGTYGFAWIGCLSSYRGVSSCTGSGSFSMTGFSFSFGSSSAKEKLPPYSS